MAEQHQPRDLQRQPQQQQQQQQQRLTLTSRKRLLHWCWRWQLQAQPQSGSSCCWLAPQAPSSSRCSSRVHVLAPAAAWATSACTRAAQPHHQAEALLPQPLWAALSACQQQQLQQQLVLVSELPTLVWWAQEQLQGALDAIMASRSVLELLRSEAGLLKVRQRNAMGVDITVDTIDWALSKGSTVIVQGELQVGNNGGAARREVGGMSGV
jgi:hypothetical protein